MSFYEQGIHGDWTVIFWHSIKLLFCFDSGWCGLQEKEVSNEKCKKRREAVVPRGYQGVSSIASISRTSEDAGTVHAVMIRIPDILTLVAHVSRTAKSMCAHCSSPHAIDFDAVPCTIHMAGFHFNWIQRCHFKFLIAILIQCRVTHIAMQCLWLSRVHCKKLN